MQKDKSKPILEHINELRKRILYSAFVIIVFSTTCWFFYDWILDKLTCSVPILNVPEIHLNFIDLTEAFGARFMISLIGGIICAFPIIIYQVCAFILPGLTPKERKALYVYLPAMILLFLTGASFAAFPMVPLARKFFLEFGDARLSPMISISSYIDFSMLLIIGMGLIFLLPIAVLFVTSIGIVSPSTLSKSRKVVWVAILVVAAAIAPNDGLTMLVIALPVVILFEISLLIAKIRWTKTAKSQTAQ